MGVEIEKTSNKYIIRFEYRPYLVTKVKSSFPKGTYRWSKEDRGWVISISQGHAMSLFMAETKAKWKHEINAAELNPLDIKEENAKMQDLWFDLPEHIYNREKKALGEDYEVMPYQKQGIAQGLKFKRFINGDQPGLGKTIEAIATAECAEFLEKNAAFPCLIICPSSLKENWKREIKSWTGKEAMILESNVKLNYRFYLESGMHEYVIVNFESLKKYFVDSTTNKKGEKMKLEHVRFRNEIKMFKSVIIDEAHRLSNPRNIQSVFCKGITKGKEIIQELTGTPVRNRPIDLTSQLSILWKMGEDGFIGYKDFIARFCQGVKQASNLGQLNKLISSNCFFRREKTEVLTELPAKTRQVIVCDIDNRDEYNVAHENLAKYMRDYMNATDKQIKKSLKGEIMVKIGILKRISAKGKLAAAVEHIKDMNSQGQKMVIFALEHTIVDALSRELPGLLKITGRESTAEIEYNKHKFQTDPEAMNILVSLKCSEGHTLTASSYPFFIEFPWTFAGCEQCEDRTHRKGQHDNVTAQYLLGHNTIDQWLYQIILDKKSMAMEVTGASDDVEENTINLLSDLFNQKEAA